jgi:hypothetical protein
MKLIAAAAALALAGALPAAAAGATLTPSPAKKCYRDDESVNLNGAGFTPNGSVTVARDGVAFNQQLLSDATGSFVGALQFAQPENQSRRTYTATDVADPALVASVRLTVSAVQVNVRPNSGTPGKVLRIGARGFTDGKALFAHILRKRKLLRNVRIGRLKGSCAKLVARKRLFGTRAKTGTYRVVFDAKRRYDPETEVSYPFTVVVSGGRGDASAAAAAWRAER